MFCKIRKGKWTYTIYACSRERVDGRVVSKDIKLCRYALHSLYEDDEEVNGLIEDLPVDLMRIIDRKILRKKDLSLDFYDDVVEKLIKLKIEYYPTYKESMIKVSRKLEEEEAIRKEKELMEYEHFKNKFRLLHNKELMEKYQEGYNRGLLENLMNTDFNNSSSGKNNSYNSKEMKLLKEAFKLLSMKHHPDKGGDNETMAAINNLKEKILK